MSKYYIKKYDAELLRFELVKTAFKEFACQNIEVIGNKTDLPERLMDNPDDVLNWLKSRIIPRNRRFVYEILKNQGLSYDDLDGILQSCLGLSVNDVYWVVPEGLDGNFKDYNLYENSFSNALSLVAFTGYSQTIQALSPSPEMTTNGMLPKAWRRIDDELYLYKGGTDPTYANGGNEPYSEYYASQIACAMNLSHVTYELEQWKGMLASTCKNFTDIQHSYVPMARFIKGNYSLEKLNSLVEELGIKKEFADMILFDAVILNADRHLGNFGLIKNNQTNQYERMAPLFDHGISLLSHLSEKNLSDEVEYKEFVETNNYSALGLSHNEMVKLFCDKSQVQTLAKLYTFKLQRHEKYNVSNFRLKRIEDLIQSRSRELTDILLGNEKESDHSDVSIKRKIEDSFLDYDYQFCGDDWSGEYAIFHNKRLILKGFLSPKDVKELDPITYIENIIEKLHGNSRKL